MMDVSVPISTRAAEVFKNFSQKREKNKTENSIFGVVKSCWKDDYEMTSAKVIC